MGQRGDGASVVEGIELIQRPERAQGAAAPIGAEQGVELRDGSGIASFGQQLQRSRAMELVRMTEEADELSGRLTLEVRVGLELGVLVAEAVQAARRGVDLVLVVLPVRDVIFIHIGHEERAVGGVRAVERTEAHVLGPHRDALVGRHVGRALRDAFGVGDRVVERIEGEQMALVFRGHRRAFDEGAEVREARDLRTRAEDRELTEGIRTARRAELARVDALLEVDAALDVMPAAGVAAVVAGIHTPVAVELQTEGIARAFAEDVVFTRLRMVAPDHAAFEVDGGGVGGIEARTDDARGRCATVHAVEPAIGTQDDSVAHRVGVFEAEAGEMHHRRAVRDVVAIGVRIEQQVRRVHHPDAAVGADGRVGHVEAILEDRVLVVDPVALRRFVDGDDVGALVVMGRRRRDAVVMRAVILVAADHVHAGGVRILAVLRDPEAAAGVEAEVRRLGDLRLGQQEVDRQVRRRAHLRISLGRGERRTMELLGAAEDAVRLAELRERRRSGLRLEGRTRRERRRGIFPRSLEHALHEVVHDERCLAEEAALPFGMPDAEHDLVPLALLQRAHRHLVAEDLATRAGADLHAVDERLVRSDEVAEMQADRFLEEVALVLGEERIVDAHPGAIPDIGGDGRAVRRRGQRHGRLGDGRNGAKHRCDQRHESTEGHGVIRRQANRTKVATFGVKRSEKPKKKPDMSGLPHDRARRAMTHPR